MKLLLALWACTAAAQTVEGTVSNSATGAPLPGVVVETSGRAATSDDRGAYRLDALAPGAYALKFSKTGFQARTERAVVSAAPVRLDVRLTALATVSGRVLDASGKPVAGANVQLFMVGILRGSDQSVKADGVFTLTGITPGTYTLSARPPRDFPDPPSDDDHPRVWVRTYYPGTEHFESAAKLAIAPGADLFGHDIMLRSVAARRVRGHVLNANGEPVPGAALTFIPDGEWIIREAQQETRADKRGAFEFARLYDGGWSAEVSVAEAKMAHRRVHVSGDLDRLDIHLSPSFDLPGRIVMDPGVPVPGTGVMLMPPGSGSHLFSAGFDMRAGSFLLKGVTEGTYTVRVPGLMPPDYIASIRLGEREILGDAVEIVSGALPITVTVKRDGGIVRGTVEDCNGAAVLIAPQDARLVTADFVRRVACGPNGAFEIGALRPGEYYAYAFAEPPGPLEYGRLALAPLTNQAVRVTVRPNEATQINLKVLARP